MESTTSREHPSPNHALRVLVRIDTQLGLACLEVRGCLTSATYPTLLNILAHTGTLGAAVSVNLLRTAHVDRDALDLLRAGADSAVSSGALAAGPGQGWSALPAPDRNSAVPVEVLAPQVLPACRLAPDAPGADCHPSGRALTNEEAADLAFVRRDPRVLPGRPETGPRGTKPPSPDL